MLKPMRAALLAVTLLAGSSSLTGCCVNNWMDPMAQAQATEGSSGTTASQTGEAPLTASPENAGLEREPNPGGTVCCGIFGFAAAFLVVVIITGGL